MSGIIGAIIFICILGIFIRFWFELWRVAIALILLAALLLFFGSIAEAHEYTPEDIVMIAKVTQHEAGNQSELGKRLVIDTILNRVESERFPNSVNGVISQPGQYCKPRKFPPEDMYRLVAEELYFRTNGQVLWYRTKRYHKYGIPIIQEGNHYFSGGI